jgi:hypothetical protein
MTLAEGRSMLDVMTFTRIDIDDLVGLLVEGNLDQAVQYHWYIDAYQASGISICQY